MSGKKNGFENGSPIGLTPDPDAPCCFNCRHGFLQRLPPPNLATVRVCKLLPPTPLAVRDKNGTIQGFASASPIVSDTDFCAHMEKRVLTLPGENQATNSDAESSPVVAGGTD